MKIKIVNELDKETKQYFTEIIENQEDMMADLSRITAAVTNLNTVVDSAVELLRGLADQIRNTALTQEALDDLAASVEGQAQELADAVVDNTPAAGEPTPEEPPVA